MTITTKYSTDQMLYFLYENEVISRPVSRIVISVTPSVCLTTCDKISIIYELVGEYTVPESKVFATKQELLESL